MAKSISAALRQLLQAKGPKALEKRPSREEQVRGAERQDATRSRQAASRPSFGSASKRPGANKTFDN